MFLSFWLIHTPDETRKRRKFHFTVIFSEVIFELLIRLELAHLTAVGAAAQFYYRLYEILDAQGTICSFVPPRVLKLENIREAGLKKSTKFHIKTVIGGLRLTFVEMATLSHIAVGRYSRAIAVLPFKVGELNLLTSGHF